MNSIWIWTSIRLAHISIKASTINVCGILSGWQPCQNRHVWRVHHTDFPLSFACLLRFSWSFQQFLDFLQWTQLLWRHAVPFYLISTASKTCSSWQPPKLGPICVLPTTSYLATFQQLLGFLPLYTNLHGVHICNLTSMNPPDAAASDDRERALLEAAEECDTDAL